MTKQEKLEKYSWALLLAIIVILIAVGVTLKIPYYNELNEKCSELAKAQKADDYFFDWIGKICELKFCKQTMIGNTTFIHKCSSEYWEIKND
jgi:hypothetical protein